MKIPRVAHGEQKTSLIEEIGRLASKSVQIFNLNRFQAGTDRPVAITILWTGNLNQLN